MMHKKSPVYFVMLFVCLLASGRVAGQTFQWASSDSSSWGQDQGTSIASDQSGNVYTIADLNYDIAIFKNDSLGNLVWLKMITGDFEFSFTAPAIATDNDGNLYLTGGFHYTVDFDPGPSVYNLSTPGGGGSSVFLLKLDSAGNFVWAKMLEGPASNEGTDIQISSSGFIVFAGTFEGTLDFDPGIGVSNSTSPGSSPNTFIIKLDTSGNFIWGANTSGGNICYSFAISTDAADNVIVSGYFGDTVDFDPGPAVYTMTALPANKMYLLKLDSSGNFVWARTIGGGATTVSCLAVQADPAGNVYASGLFSDTCDFDPGIGVYNGISNNGSADCYVVKLNSNGNFEWVATFGGIYNDRTHGIACLPQGGVVLTGGHRDGIDFDPGPGTFILGILGNVGNSNAFILALDSNGDFINAITIGGDKWDQGNAVVADASGNIYLTGCFTDTVDFNPPFQYNLISEGAFDIFTMKYGPVNVGVDEVKNDAHLVIYPVPGNGSFTVEFDDFYSGTFVITNLLGELVTSGSFENTGMFRCEIEGSPGIYLVSVTTGNSIFNSKLVKN